MVGAEAWLRRRSSTLKWLMVKRPAVGMKRWAQVRLRGLC